eukprot:3895995-Prymnesium_polylepis.3
MRSHLRPRKHLSAKQARERISHIESSRASPLHTPGATLGIMDAPRRGDIDSRQDDLLKPQGWRAAPSEVPAPVLIGALEVTCGAAAHVWMSKVQAMRLGRPPLT